MKVGRHVVQLMGSHDHLYNMGHRHSPCVSALKKASQNSSDYSLTLTVRIKICHVGMTEL